MNQSKTDTSLCWVDGWKCYIEQTIWGCCTLFDDSDFLNDYDAALIKTTMQNKNA